jgi:intracellular multiplication protein IcmK
MSETKSVSSVYRRRLTVFCAAGLFFVTGGAAALPAFAQDGGPFLPGQEEEFSPPSTPLPTMPSSPPGAVLPPGPGQAFSFGEDAQFDFEKDSAMLEEEARREAFDAALEGLLPLRPDEIRELLERFDKTQESVELPVYPYPKPELKVEQISLDPGVKPAVLKTAYGHVTSIGFLDVSGAPWPIEDISWAGDFEVIDGSAKGMSHILNISPQSEFAYGNMVVRLLTLKTPVILTLEANREIVYYRFDAIVPDYGPFAEAPLIEAGITTKAGDQDMTSVLEGVIPPDAERLKVAGADARTSAYRYNGMTYLRTPLTLLSPGWDSSVASADGTRVYSFGDAPVVLLSDKGKMIRVHLSDREDILDE